MAWETVFPCDFSRGFRVFFAGIEKRGRAYVRAPRIADRDDAIRVLSSAAQWMRELNLSSEKRHKKTALERGGRHEENDFEVKCVSG